MLPCASPTGRPAPIAAAIGSSISDTRLCASSKGRLLHRIALDVGDTARHAKHNARKRQAATANSADEIPKHVRGDVEISDDTMPQRANRPNRRRRTADHPLRVLTHRMDATARLIDRYNGRLKYNNALAAHEHERVRCAEVDRQLAATLKTALTHSPRTRLATASAGQPSRPQEDQSQPVPVVRRSH
jgi:hypothetical protein